MYLAIITLPILGSIFSGLFGRKIGVSGAHLITCTCIIVTTLLAIVAFVEVGLNNIPVTINLFRWIDSESLNVSWGFHFDSLTVSMLIPVLIVSSLVHIYSIGYMSHDPHNQRFFSYLSLFTFMMIILVTANNFLLMFVGWEGVGVCSYLLISFWFTRIAANQSSMSAFLTNRVGDCFFTIGMFAILWTFGNIDYSTVFSLAPFVNLDVVTIIGICLFIGAMAKSSQVGLHVWLPMAMEGPTPVSALIHAATMVTAGVYLLMRASPLLEYSSTVLMLCLWLGAITTVFSSLIGLFQQDIKKVIAYSTMSQLGMMVIAVGLSSYNIALFHLVNHAFYKALLFLGAGAVIHAVADNQDFRKYGGLRPFLPLTYSVMLIASLSLVAFPFMTGFYSKDFILESAYGQFYFSGTVVYYIATIGAMFTTLYSVKVLYLTFLANPNGPVVNYKHAHEGDIYMSLPLIILAVFSIFFGYITKDIFIGLGSGFYSDNSLFIHPTHEIMLDTEFAVPTIFKLLPLIFTVSLSVLTIILSEFIPKIILSFKFSRLGYNIFGFFNQRFYIELFYNKYITGFILNMGGQTTKVIDKGSVELLGPYGLEKGLINLSRHIASLDTGVITSYALYILIGFIFYFLIPYLAIFDNSLFLLIILSLFSVINKVVVVYKPSVNTIESLAKPYKFSTLPLQSKISLNSFIKHLTLVNVVTSLIIFITFFWLRFYIFPEASYLTKLTGLDRIPVDFYVNKDLFLGTLATISRYSLKGFIEDLLEAFGAEKLHLGPLAMNQDKLEGDLGPLAMNQDKLEGDPDKTTVRSIEKQKILENKVLDELYTETLIEEFETMKVNMGKITKWLDEKNTMLSQDTLTTNNPATTKLLIMLIQDQNRYLDMSIRNRVAWVDVTAPNLPRHVWEESTAIKEKIEKLHVEHWVHINRIRNIENQQVLVKEFFDFTNAYRNKVRVEIIKLETVSHDGFRKYLPDLYKMKEFKQLVNKDVPKARLEVVEQDNYLKKKISEIINAKKK